MDQLKEMPVKARLWAALTVGLVPALLSAQQAPLPARIGLGSDFVVRVHVADSAGHPVAAADISVVRGLAATLAHGTSDGNGDRTLRVPRGVGDLQVIARRIGYLRAERFIEATANDTLTIEIQMQRAVVSLAPVTVTAQEDLKRKSYFVDADDIAKSSRLIMNGMDVLTKMRPDILTGRAPGCGVRDVYVNGVRIVDPPVNEMAVAHIPRTQLPPIVVPKDVGYDGKSTAVGGSRRAAGIPTAPRAVWSIMWTIKPEHIEQMVYKDCFDTSMPGTHGSSALYVVLKPGVAYDPVRGSYVDDSVPPNGVDGQGHNRELSRVIPQGHSVAVPLYRRRLVGVYDAVSGDPVTDAQVIDDATGAFVRTSKTGTATLTFLQEGKASLTIRKTGFKDLKVDVTVSPADTLPLTLVLPRPK